MTNVIQAMNLHDLNHFYWGWPVILLGQQPQNQNMGNSTYSQEMDFLEDGPWDELYAITQNWKSDLEFYKDDLRFLHHLTDRYFLWITKSENMDVVKELNFGLLKLTIEVKDLLEKVKKHLVQLGYLMEDPNKRDAGITKTEHLHLEEELTEFVKSFRNNRKEVFKISEYIIDSEELADKLH